MFFKGKFGFYRQNLYKLLYMTKYQFIVGCYIFAIKLERLQFNAWIKIPKL